MKSFPRTILFSLAVFGDIVRILPKSKRESWNFWFGGYDPVEKAFNRQSFTNAVSRLLKTEKIEKSIRAGRVKIRATPKGLRLLSLELDLEKFSRKSWDGQWRLVVFDIEERDRRERNFLRRKLKKLGFGMLQESIWISPFPLEGELSELLDGWRLRGDILVAKSEVLTGDQKALAKRVWRVDKILNDYIEIRESWEKLLPGERVKGEALKFQQAYFGLLEKDPYLPRELLPDDWKISDEVRKLYLTEVLKILSS